MTEMEIAKLEIIFLKRKVNKNFKRLMNFPFYFYY